jgi:hypothetical protein
MRLESIYNRKRFYRKKTGRCFYGYTNKTGVDFLVADLGTEQQSGAVGKFR